MAKAKKHNEKKHQPHGYYIRMSSLIDLARDSCSIGGGASHITAVRQGGKYRLFSIGEKFENTRVLYCIDIDSKGDTLVYNPNSEEEECGFRSVVPASPDDYKKFKIPVVEIDGSLYSITNKLSASVPSIRVKSIDELAKSIVSDMSGRTESVRLYSFFYKNQHVIGTFSLFRDGPPKTFAYTVIDSKEPFGYLQYNYISDSVGFCRNTTEKSLIYLRIINLAEPFPFFKDKPDGKA
jgi:hypothetical protein